MIEYFRGTSPLLEGLSWHHGHREGIWDCGICGADYYNDMAIFDRKPYLLQVIFEPKWYKRGCIITLSSCPKCGEVQWVHREIESFSRWLRSLKETNDPRYNDYDEDLLERLEPEVILMQRGKADWDNSLCKQCLVKKEVKEDRFAYTVDCKDKGWSRMGSPVMPTEKYPCEKFRQRKRP